MTTASSISRACNTASGPESLERGLVPLHKIALAGIGLDDSLALQFRIRLAMVLRLMRSSSASGRSAGSASPGCNRAAGRRVTDLVGQLKVNRLARLGNQLEKSYIALTVIEQYYR